MHMIYTIPGSGIILTWPTIYADKLNVYYVHCLIFIHAKCVLCYVHCVLHTCMNVRISSLLVPMHVHVAVH